MKKLRYSRRAVRSQEQPAPLETSIFAEQQAQAKSGTITAPSGSNAVVKALGDSAPVQNTLAGIARDALSASVADSIAIINLANRTVTTVPAGTDISTVTGHAGLHTSGAFSFDDPTKATGPMSFDGSYGDLGPLVSPIVDAAKPSMSVESLCNKIEDVADEHQVALGKSAIIVIDQDAKTVEVFEATVANIEATTPATLLAEEAHFVQTLVPSSGRQFGE